MSNRNSNSNSNNRRRPHDGNVGPRTQHDEDDYHEEDVEEDEGENMHNDFSAGKNPTRQAASRRVAQERGHEAFAEMGRKGGKSNAGVHAGIDYDNPEHDDEGGVPAKNPNRVRGGKQAAKTREEHGNMSMSEMGRMGGQSNRGKPHLTQSNYDDEDGDYNQRDNKNPNRVRGGQQAASKRSHEDFVEMGRKGGRSSNGGNSQSNSRQSGGQSSQSRSTNQRQSGGNQSQSQSTPPRDALGHFVSTKNSNQRNSSGNNRSSSGNGRGRQGSNQFQRKGDNEDDDEDNEDHEEDDHEDEEGGDNTEGKNPNRVRGGKRAASHRSHEDFVRMGKMGAEARWGHSYDNHDDDNEDDNEDHDDDHEDDHDNGDNTEGKNPNRVRGGKQAAAKRSHEDFVEMGRKGGRSNQGRSKSSNNEDDDEDDDDSDNRRNSNKRRRSNQQTSQSSYSPAKMFTY